VIDNIKDEVQADDEAAQSGSEIGTLPADERKSNEILEIGINPPNKIDGCVRAMFVDVPKNS
jgi:hypothetical protein